MNIPPGYWLAPLEATDAMTRAAWGKAVMSFGRASYGDLYAAMRDAHLAAHPEHGPGQPVTQWQPIETAPKDGRAMFGCVKRERGTDMAVMAWNNGQWCDLEQDMAAFDPTHWQPVPGVPE